MMYVEFDNSLVTGNCIIDEQHRELIEKINKLVGTIKVGGGKLESIKMLDYLMDYTDFHFKEEEQLQIEAEYPGLKEHIKKHEEFKKAVKELHEMLEDQEGPTDAFVEAVQKNVVDWMLNHIKGFDCSVATYIHMKSVPELL